VTEWHPSPELLAAYEAGSLTVSLAWSIEAHVAACAGCRAGVGVDLVRLETIWQATTDSIDAPRPRLVERALAGVGVPDHLARLLGATPSLTVPWLLAVAAVLGFALAMAWSAAGDPRPAARNGLFLFLLLAPAAPVAGVAMAFGPVADPAHDVAVASPFHGFRLLMIRTVAVVGTSILVALALALLLPHAGLLAAAWILPGLALAAATLAASTFVRPIAAAGFLVALWFGVVVAVEVGPNSLVAFGRTGQVACALILALAALVLAARRDSFEVAA
jgi:hypothetical protein